MGISAGAAAGIGAAVSAGTSIAGGIAGSGSVASGQAAANAAQQQGYDEYAKNEAPYLSTGTNALTAAGDATGLNGAAGNANALTDFQASPGYQYQLQQGLSAVDNGAASTGTLRSGNTIRAEETLGSNLANQDFNQYYTRINQLATLGQTATSALGGAGVSTAQGIAGTDASAATADAKLDTGVANSLGNAAQTGLNSLVVKPTALTATPTGPANPTGKGL